MMNNKLNSVNSSKDLLYPEYAGTTVVERALESIEKKSNKTTSERIEMFLKTKKSVGVERAKRLIPLMDKKADDAKDVKNMDDENNASKEIDVVLEISKNADGSNRDAWFILRPSEDKMSECSEEEYDEDSSPLFRRNKILGVDSDSSDTDENDEYISFSKQYSNSPHFVFSDTSNFSEYEVSNALVTEESNLIALPNNSDKNNSKTETPVNSVKGSLSNFHKPKETAIDSPKKEQISGVDSKTLTSSGSGSPFKSRKRKLISIIEDGVSSGRDQQKSCIENKKRN